MTKKKRFPSSSRDFELLPSTPTVDPTNLSTICDISPSQSARITESYSHSLIACVVGRKIDSQYLHDRLLQIFHLTGSLTVTELGRGFFVLKFSKSADCNEAYGMRPLPIPNLCIALFPWTPNFKPSEALITHFDVWIRLPELCIEYYDKEVLRQIAECIGSLVKIDPVTERLQKCKFARLCVNLNLSNPLPSEIKLGEISQKIEYEGLRFLCSQCRLVGDLVHDCLTNPSGYETQHRAFSYQHPHCRQNSATGLSSKQPRIPSELTPSASRFQVLGEEEEEEEENVVLELDSNSNLPMGEYKTAAVSTDPPQLPVTQKKHHFPVTKAKEEANFNMGKQKEVSRVPVHKLPEESAQENVIQSKPLSFTSNSEASSMVTDAPELKRKNLVQSMPLAPSVAGNQLTVAVHDSQPQPLTIRIPSPQSLPVSEASLKFYSTGIQHSTTKKEIFSTPSTEISAESSPTVYTINPVITKLGIVVSEVRTSASNQYVINFDPTVGLGNKYGTGPEALSASCSKKLLYWNYRGTDRIKLSRALKDLIELHEPSIVLVFGTKISGADADEVLQEFAYWGSCCRKPDGYGNGIWLLMSRKDVQVEIKSYSLRQISASISFHNETETSSQLWGPNFFYTSRNFMDNTLAY